MRKFKTNFNGFRRISKCTKNKNNFLTYITIIVEFTRIFRSYFKSKILNNKSKKLNEKSNFKTDLTILEKIKSSSSFKSPTLTAKKLTKITDSALKT